MGKKRHPFALLLLPSVATLFLSSAVFADRYDDLELPRNASFEEVKKAHRRLQKLYHPDHTVLPKDVADRRFKEVQAAYEHFKRIEDRNNGWDVNVSPKYQQNEPPPKRKSEAEIREEIKKATKNQLEAAWASGNFGASTLEMLPERTRRRQAFKNNWAQVIGVHDAGEWDGIVEFMNSRGKSYLENSPSFSEVEHLMAVLDDARYSGQDSYNSIATSIKSRLHAYQLEIGPTESDFAKTVLARLRDYEAVEQMQKHEFPSSIYQGKLQSLVEKFQERFGSKSAKGDRDPTIRFMDAILENAIAAAAVDNIGSKDLERSIRYLVLFVEPADKKLKLLGDLGVALDKNIIKPASRRIADAIGAAIETAIRQTFSAHPELRKQYSKNTGWLKPLFGGGSECEAKLSKIARAY